MTCVSSLHEPRRASWLWRGSNGYTHGICFGCYFWWLTHSYGDGDDPLLIRPA